MSNRTRTEGYDWQAFKLVLEIWSSFLIRVPHSESLERLHHVLNRMDDKQVASEKHSWHPIPQIPLNSSSAWNTLYESTMQKTIVPVLERWKGSLDTLMIFIALFSAIVTTFYIQASNNLSPNPAVQTNVLLANLTNIIVAATLNTNHLSPQPIIRDPIREVDAATIRLNFYWSTSLILSISIASLAVISRGYLVLLVKSRYAQTHKKLTDIHRRWEVIKNPLGSLIIALPLLLLLSVLVFLAGLLDSMISTWLSTSFGSSLGLAAIILAVIFVAGVVFITLFVIALYLPLRPDLKSAMPRLGIKHGFLQLDVPAWRPHLFFSSTSNDDLYCRESFALPSPLTRETVDTFCKCVRAMDNDDSLGLVAATLVDVLCSDVSNVHSNTRQPDLSDQALQTVCFLLSHEASIRTNATAASAILQLHGDFCWPYDSPFDPATRVTLLRSLQAAAERCSTMSTQSSHSSLLWDSSFTKAMIAIVSNDRYQNIIAMSNPLMLLFSDYTCVPAEERASLRTEILLYTLEIIRSQLRRHLPSSAPTSDHAVADTDWDRACDKLLAPYSHQVFGSGVRSFISSGNWDNSFLLSIIFRWLSRVMGIQIVIIVIQAAIENPNTCFITRDINVLGLVTAFTFSNDPQEDARILIPHLVKLLELLQRHSGPDTHHTARNDYLLQYDSETWCDFFCHYARPIIDILERMHHRLRDSDLALVCIDADVAWEALCRIMKPTPKTKHRDELSRELLHAFRPFFVAS